MAQPDTVLHQPVRLRIMAALKAVPSSEAIEFVRLRALVDATDGNLGAHLATLERAAYVEIKKDFVGKRPRTRVWLTKAGRRALESYVAYLRDIIDT